MNSEQTHLCREFIFIFNIFSEFILNLGLPLSPSPPSFPPPHILNISELNTFPVEGEKFYMT